MPTPETEKIRPISIWKRLLVMVGLFVIVLLVIGFVQSRYQGARLRKALEERMARLDETDPGWRLEELDAARNNPPPSRNSAIVMMDALGRVPTSGNLDGLEKTIGTVALPYLLDEERRQTLEKELPVFEPALAVLRRIADIPEGRHKLAHVPNPIMTVLDDQSKTRVAVRLLALDGLQRSMQQQSGQAMRSCRAALNAARTLNDEPFLISQLIRAGCVSVALGMMERTLALGEPPADELATTAEVLAREENHPTYRVAIRGERAMMHGLFQGLASGAIRKEELGLMEGLNNISLEWRLRLFGWSRARIAEDHDLLLRILGDAVAITSLPMHEQSAAEKALAREIRKLPAMSIARLVLPATDRMGEAFRRKSAGVRCMQVLIALERHRLATGNWPARLEDLPRELLPAVPLDPFDGKPLRYVRRADGVSVYSIGLDGVDDGGMIDPDRKFGPGVDLDFRLWDVKARRQPPRAPEALQGLGSP